MNRNRCDRCPHCQAQAIDAPGGVTDTSVRAAESIRPNLRATEARILGYIASPTYAPLTANRIAELSGIPLGTVRPRITYLHQIGRVRDSGQRFKIGKRCTAIAWELAQ